MVWVLVGAHTHTHKESTRKGTRRTSFAAASKIYAHTHTHAQAPTVVAPHPTPRAPRARHSPPHPPHHPFLHAMSSSSSTGHLRAARPTGAVAPTARAPRRRPLPVLHRAPPWHSRRVSSTHRLVCSSAPSLSLSPRFIQRSSRSISAFPRCPLSKHTTSYVSLPTRQCAARRTPARGRHRPPFHLRFTAHPPLCHAGTPPPLSAAQHGIILSRAFARERGARTTPHRYADAFTTAFVPSAIACFASSAGSSRRTAV